MSLRANVPTVDVLRRFARVGFAMGDGHYYEVLRRVADWLEHHDSDYGAMYSIGIELIDADRGEEIVLYVSSLDSEVGDS